MYFGGDFVGKKIVVWGFVFKFGIDDICEVLVLVFIE